MNRRNLTSTTHNHSVLIKPLIEILPPKQEAAVVRFHESNALLAAQIFQAAGAEAYKEHCDYWRYVQSVLDGFDADPYGTTKKLFALKTQLT